MPDVTAADVKALRERTDLPMMECKRALVEADGDADKAVEILKKQFKKIQDKRSENATEEGRIFIAITETTAQPSLGLYWRLVRQSKRYRSPERRDATNDRRIIGTSKNSPPSATDDQFSFCKESNTWLDELMRQSVYY